MNDVLLRPFASPAKLISSAGHLDGAGARCTSERTPAVLTPLGAMRGPPKHLTLRGFRQPPGCVWRSRRAETTLKALPRAPRDQRPSVRRAHAYSQSRHSAVLHLGHYAAPVRTLLPSPRPRRKDKMFYHATHHFVYRMTGTQVNRGCASPSRSSMAPGPL